MKCEFDPKPEKEGYVYCPTTKEDVPEDLAPKYAKAYRSGGLERAKLFLEQNQTKKT